MSTIRKCMLLCVTVAVTLCCETALALVTKEEFQPGEIQLGFVRWKYQNGFLELLKSQRSVGGQETSASWGGSSVRMEYFYEGRTEDLQRMIDQIDKLNYPLCCVIFTEHDGYWESRRLGNPVPYDWSVTFAESNLYRKSLNGIDNQPQVVLAVHLGHRLDRAKLVVSDRLRNNPAIPGEYRVHPDKPADAYHAILRARRPD